MSASSTIVSGISLFDCLHDYFPLHSIMLGVGWDTRGGGGYSHPRLANVRDKVCEQTSKSRGIMLDLVEFYSTVAEEGVLWVKYS